MTDVLVAGSGRCGVHTARLLADSGLKVMVVERLPQTGGQEPEDDARAMERAATRAGVEFLLGTLAVSYRDGIVHTLGIEGARSVNVRALVLATGTRPQTRAELAIAGDRGAGVVPGSAALHFLDSGLLLGRNPVVIGHGELALHLSHKLLSKGAHSVVSVSELPRQGTWPEGVQSYENARVGAVRGFPRVHTAEIVGNGTCHEIITDAVILASGRIPMRNIEGAIHPGPTIYDCFSTDDPKTDRDALRVSRATATSIANAIR